MEPKNNPRGVNAGAEEKPADGGWLSTTTLAKPADIARGLGGAADGGTFDTAHAVEFLDLVLVAAGAAASA